MDGWRQEQGRRESRSLSGRHQVRVGKGHIHSRSSNTRPRRTSRSRVEGGYAARGFRTARSAVYDVLRRGPQKRTENVCGQADKYQFPRMCFRQQARPYGCGGDFFRGWLKLNDHASSTRPRLGSFGQDSDRTEGDHIVFVDLIGMRALHLARLRDQEG